MRKLRNTEQHREAVLTAALAVLGVDQPELTEPEHVSCHMNRTEGEHGVPERVYLEEWRKENRRSPGVNGGLTVLEHLLSRPHPRYPQTRIVQPVTQRDAVVAASFAQWLGTNCGQGFLRAAERRVARWEARRRELENLRWRGHFTKRKGAKVLALALAQPFKGHPAHDALVRGVAAALEVAERRGLGLDSEPVPDAARAVTLRGARDDDDTVAV